MANLALERGPIRERNKTDTMCLPVFCGVIVVTIALGVAGGFLSNVEGFFVPIDGDNNRCGFAQGYENYPYLFITYPEIEVVVNETNQYTTGVCVKECPSSFDETLECKETDWTTENLGTCDNAEVYETAANEYNYCLEVIEEDEDEETETVEKQGVDWRKASQWISLSLIGCCTAVMVSYIFVLLVEFVGARVLLWIIFVVIGLLVITGAALLTTELNYLAVPFFVLAIVASCVLFCIRNNIKLALAILDATVAFVNDTKEIILVPLFHVLLKIPVMLALWVALFLVATSVDYQTAPGGDNYLNQEPDIVSTALSTVGFIFLTFSFFWCVFLINALGDFVEIVSVITWYYSKGSDQKDGAEIGLGFQWAYITHVGTLIYGAGILALIETAKQIQESMRKKMRKGGKVGAPALLIFCIISCLFYCLRDLIQYITKNAYIQCGLQGKGFCDSGKDAFGMIFKHMIKFYATESFTTILKISGFIFIFFLNISLSGGIFYALALQTGSLNDFSNRIVLPLILVAFFTIFVISLFTAVFETVTITILNCYVNDIDINEQLGRAASANTPAILSNFIDANNLMLQQKHKGQAPYQLPPPTVITINYTQGAQESNATQIVLQTKTDQ